MRILFLGSGEFGLPTLAALAREHTIVGVVTQPDRPAGRNRRLTPTPIGAWAAEHLPGCPLFKPEDVNQSGVVEAVRALPAEAWVIIAFGQKLSPALIEGRFAINLHASLLPRWRGAAPIHRAMIAGDSESGNSVITIADRMDAGLVLGRSRRAIAPNISAGELHDQLAHDGPELIQRVLQQHAEGTLRPESQDETLVTKAAKLSKAEGWVDWSAPAAACRARIHGLSPWPGVTATIQGESVKLLRVADELSPSSAPPGTLFEAALGLVACGGGTALRLIEVQPANGKPMAWADFVRGRSLPLGTLISSGESPPA